MRTHKTERKERHDVIVSRRLRKALVERGVTVKELASATGIPAPTLYKDVSGKVSMSAYNLALICSALSIDANEILGVRNREADLTQARGGVR